jgi:hypothetical protein
MGGSIVYVIIINICHWNYSIDDTTVGLKCLWYIPAISSTAGSPAVRFVVDNVERNSKMRNSNYNYYSVWSIGSRNVKDDILVTY